MGLDKGLNRREFLKKGVASIAVGIVGAKLHSEGQQQDTIGLTKKFEDVTSEQETIDESFLNVPYEPKKYVLGPIADRRVPRKGEKGKTSLEPIQFNKLLSQYTGIKGPIQKEVEIDFRFQLAEMWKEKLGLMKQKDGTYPKGILENVRNIFMSFDRRNVEPMSIEDYRSEIRASLAKARADLGLDRTPMKIKNLPAFKHFTPNQVALVKSFERNITTDSLFAYALTELMPTSGSSASMGIEIFEEMLRHGGRQFVGRIPALADGELSFGDYQFTPPALQENYNFRPGKKKGTFIREENFGGASQINKLLQERMIPKQVGELRGSQHHAAAYLYAVYNIARAVDGIGDDLSGKLLANFSQIPKGVTTEYIASAHHLPGAAIKAFNEYVKDFAEYYELPLEERKKAALWDFRKHCGEISKRVGEYCNKTHGNVIALQKRFGN